MKRTLAILSVILAALVGLGAATDKFTVNRSSGGVWSVILNVSGTPRTLLSIGSSTLPPAYITTTDQLTLGTIALLPPTTYSSADRSGLYTYRSTAAFEKLGILSRSGLVFNDGSAGNSGGYDNIGAWTIGPSGRQSVTGNVGQQNNGALLGNPNTQNFSVVNSGTATFVIGRISFATALCIVQSGTIGISAVIQVGPGVAIINQSGGTYFVTGSPSGTQAQLSYIGASSSLVFTAGNTGASSLFISCMGANI